MINVPGACVPGIFANSALICAIRLPGFGCVLANSGWRLPPEARSSVCMTPIIARGSNCASCMRRSPSRESAFQFVVATVLHVDHAAGKLRKLRGVIAAAAADYDRAYHGLRELLLGEMLGRMTGEHMSTSCPSTAASSSAFFNRLKSASVMKI